MEQPELRGNFVAYMNRDKQPGDRKPSFDGRVSIPGAKSETRFALWSYEYVDPKTGETKVMLNGKADAVSFTDTADAQLAKLARPNAGESIRQGTLDLAPGQIAMFPNGFKNDEPKPDKERPDYYGYYNPGNGEKLVRIGAWLSKDRYQHPMLQGATSYPRPDKTERDQQADEPELTDLIESGAVTKGLKGGKGKSASMSSR